MMPGPRAIAGLVAAACAAALLIALYMEHGMGLVPCPLCMMQRIWVGIVGLLALGATVHGRALATWAGAAIGAALVGSGFSLRQLWLQGLPPDQVPACGPDLDYMLEVFPFTDVLRAMVMGTGNCAEVTWTLLGLSLPAWVLVTFLGLIGASALQWHLARR